MVSRRKILSRSRDDLNMMDGGYLREEEEDVWYQKEKLYRDHIQEVLGKWESIDDEIWAKVIVLERNRRVAKAYARAPVLTVNGSTDGFDGFRIGVNGFENPMRDTKTAEFKTQIGQGCKLKMDETGNILVKRFSTAPVYVKNVLEETAVSNDILKLPNGLLEPEVPFRLFDMKKFQQNLNRELKRARPDRRKVECQCVSTVAFVKNERELLDSPIWVMLINVVALEMLKAKMPEISTGTTHFPGIPAAPTLNGSATTGRPGVRHSSEPRSKRFVPSGSSDEDPYSLTPSGSSGSSGKGGSGGAAHNSDGATATTGNGSSGGSSNRLPAREKEYFGPQNWAKNQRQLDYSDEMEEDTLTLTKKQSSRIRPSRRSEEKRKSKNSSSSNNNNNSSSGDDPYYCGLRARVPNFSKTRKGNASSGNLLKVGRGGEGGPAPPPSKSVPNLQALAQQPHLPPSASSAALPAQYAPFWWHSRMYHDQRPSLGVTPGGDFHYAGRINGRSYQRAFLALPHQQQQQQQQRQQTVFRTGWE